MQGRGTNLLDEDEHVIAEKIQLCLANPLLPALYSVLSQARNDEKEPDEKVYLQSQGGGSNFRGLLEMYVLELKKNKERNHELLETIQLEQKELTYFIDSQRNLISNFEQSRPFSSKQKLSLEAKINEAFDVLFYAHLGYFIDFVKQQSLTDHHSAESVEFQLEPPMVDGNRSNSTCSSMEMVSNSTRKLSKFERFPRPAQKVLRAWLDDHFDNPYPTKAEKRDLCKKCGVTMHQLNQWFTNSRMRLWKPSKKVKDKQSK